MVVKSDMKESKKYYQEDEVPKYVEIYNKLLDYIKKAPAGSKLPTEEVLAQQFNTSRNTLRQALQILQEDKVIYKRRGSGTYISEVKEMINECNLNEYCTIEEFFVRQGLKADLHSIIITLESADSVCADLLNIPLNSQVMVVNRVYTKNDKQKTALAQVLDFIPYSLVTSLNLLEVIGDKLDVIRRVEAIGVMSQTSIIATKAGKIYSKTMNVSEDTPLLLLQQLVYDKSNEKKYLNKIYFNSLLPDYYLKIMRS